MAMNFDSQLNQVRSILRGEVNGSARFVLLLLGALVVWLAVPWLSGMSKDTLAGVSRQQRDYSELTRMASEYRALGPRQDMQGTADAMTAFTQVSAQIALGDRVNRIVPTSDGKRLSIEVNRIHAEELTDMIRELAHRGIRVISAELRALPAGSDRLFSLTAVIGPEA